MRLVLQRDSELPLYRQLVEQITAQIVSGALAPGTRLPPVRRLADEYGLTRLTVHNAYAELQANGLVESFVGRGTYVQPRPDEQAGLPPPPLQRASQGLLADMMRQVAHPGVISFAQAHPDERVFPHELLEAALSEALRHPAALNYGPAQGEQPLREQVARYLGGRGIRASAEQVLIMSGAQQGIDLALRAFSRPGEVLLIEEPTYPGALEAAAQQGLSVVGIPVDAGGIKLAAVEAACEAYKPRLLYLVPTFHNPSGVSLAPERRAALLELARRHKLLIIEDDTYGPLSYAGPPPPALAAADRWGVVITLVSFSKIFIPGLRLGAMVASQEQLPALLAAKRSCDLLCSPLLQRALALILERDLLRPHVEYVLTMYRARFEATIAALERWMPDAHWLVPQGGFSVWVALPECISEREFVLDAAERGVALAPGRAFFAKPQRGAYFRLSFASRTVEEIDAAVRALGGLLDEHLQRRDQLAARAWRETAPLI